MKIIDAEEHKAFETTRNKGFRLKFPNGLVLSTQFGWGNYCGNYPNGEFPSLDELKEKKDSASNDCEIAIFDSSGRFITEEYNPQGGDSVLGWVKMERWLEIVDWCRAYKCPKKVASRKLSRKVE